MFGARATGRLAAALALWVTSAVAATSQVDAIYRDLGRGDPALALAASARLLVDPPADPRARANALQARLDVLAQDKTFDATAVQSLQAAIAAFASKHSRYAALAERLTLARAVAARDADAIAASVDRLATQLSRPPDGEQVESRSAAALALAATEPARARGLGLAALEYWQRQNDAKAAWRQAQLAKALAQIAQNAGDLPRALHLLEDASRAGVRAFGADSAVRASIDNARAGVLSAMGRGPDMLGLREQVWTSFRELRGPDAVETAKHEALFGAALQERGDYARARAHYANAAAIFARSPAAAARERAILHTNFGNLLQEMGATDEALASYQRALELFGSGPETARVRAIVSANIGNTEFRRRHFAAAKAQFAKALALREAADGAASPGLAFALDGLGSTSLALRDYAQAESHFRRALDLLGRNRADNHPTLGPLRFGLALARWGQGDARGAFALAAQTVRQQQAVMASFAGDSAERQSVAFRQVQVPATALVVSLAARLGDAPSIAAAWQLAMAERGLIARAQAQRLVAARAQANAKTAAALARWQGLNRALGDAWLAVPADPARLAALREASEAAERALWPREVNVSVSALQTPVLADLAKALPEDGVLIAYSEGVAADPARLLIAGQQMVPEDWYAFVLDGRGAPRLARVGGIRALSAQIHAWYLGLRAPGGDAARLRSDGLAVRRALYDPLVAGSQAKRIFVVPEGELYRVDFAALPARDGTGYLIESVAGVHTLARESDILAAPGRTGNPAVLLAGAPRLGATNALAAGLRSPCRAAPAQFAPIPNAGRELDALRTLFATAAGANVSVLRDAQATHARIVPALARANVAHLATHGFAYDADCADVQGRRGVSLAAAADVAERPAEAGLSGLALTAARASRPVDVLGADELATLDLRSLDWIVLSACDSGLGAIGRNEGVFGMRRALRVAGARVVIMSLWPVDDAATVDLMQGLYRARFIDRQPVSEALGAAMRGELARRRSGGLSDHPFYWAAFVSEGGWR